MFELYLLCCNKESAGFQLVCMSDQSSMLHLEPRNVILSTVLDLMTIMEAGFKSCHHSGLKEAET